MAADFTMRDDVHFETCPLHNHDKTTKCCGKLRKGGSCSNKAIGPPVLGMMPTCKVHRDQMKVMAWCQSPLPCGFACRRHYEWKPHGFQLCAEHDHLRPCYFLEIPTELRFRIYQYLLPGRDILAQRSYSNQSQLYQLWDGQKLFWDILFVNRQIHEESIRVLYSNRFFNIDFDGTSLMMCNMGPVSPHIDSFRAPQAHHAQNYQMQLMLLEQQNKKRIMMARAEQDRAITTASSSNAQSYSLSSHNSSTARIPSTGFSNPAPNLTISNSPTASTSPPTPKESFEPIWIPPIKQMHFNLIRSFRVRVLFIFPIMPGSATDEKLIETKLYESTDHLHTLVERLSLTPSPIVRFEVAIIFSSNSHLSREKAFSYAQVLLQPFQRLRNVVNPGVSSITTVGTHNPETELLPTCNAVSTDKGFAEYVEQWSRALSSDEVKFIDPSVFGAYWQLKKLLLSIKRHCHDPPKLEEFTELLHAARVVREENNLPQFREIWDRIVNVWFDYLSEEKEFQSNVAMSIDGIYRTVSGGEVEVKGKCRAWG